MSTFLRSIRLSVTIGLVIFISIVTISITTQDSYAAEIRDTGTCGENATWVLYDDLTLVISGTGIVDGSQHYGSFFYRTYKNVVIEPGITGIGEEAFKYSDIESITIPGSVKTIGEFAFYSTPLKNVTISNGVTTIEKCAFEDTEIESITIPDGVTSIGNSAFDDCKMLNIVQLPNSVTSIGDYAFSGCTNLENIELPTMVEYFGRRVFYGCSNLESVVLPEGITNIESFMFGDCAKINSVVLPKSTTVLEDYAFSNCTELNSIVLPESITSIGESAFFGCADLTNIVVPDGITIIEDSTFYGCSGLESVTIPESVTSIGEAAFCKCKRLKNVVVPRGVKTLEWNVFCGCSKLESVTLPQNCTKIGYSVFEGCTSLTSIKIPENVKYIGMDAFNGCKSLKKIEFKGTKIKDIDFDAFIKTPVGIKLVCPSTVRTKYKRKMMESGARFSKIKVTFKANGGKVKKKSKKVYPYYEYGKLPTPKRKNYDFVGWYTRKKGGYKVKSSEEVETSKSHTLYAHWKKPKPNFTCDVYAYNTRSNTIVLSVINESKHKLTILPYGAKIIDLDFKRYDRRLKRSKSVRLGEDDYKKIKFKVIGRHTWPGTDRKIMYLNVKFCGKKYRVKCDDYKISKYKSGRKWKNTFR